jgi:hypothetical protein
MDLVPSEILARSRSIKFVVFFPDAIILSFVNLMAILVKTYTEVDTFTELIFLC